MFTKIVYTLVSDESDNYYEQALISLYSLRLYHPRPDIVVLVVDENTDKTLTGEREEIKKYVSEIISIQVPTNYDKKHSSRYLKTRLREFIKGDYLFIDCDTIICKPLSDIDDISAPLAMVSDLNDNLPLQDETVIARCEKGGLGYLKGKPYFNSGVIYAKDTPDVHRFYEEWHKNWKLSAEKGVPFDQPALCKTNADSESIIEELPAIWNCQFKYAQGYQYLNKALIMHYFNPNGSKAWSYPTDTLFAAIKDKGFINENVDKLIRHPKTSLYAIMTINKDSAYRFFNSEMTYIYFCQPRLYKILLSVAKISSRVLNCIRLK